MDALLARESNQRSPGSGNEDNLSACLSASPLHPDGQNDVWRERVVLWYFAVISALNQQHRTSSSANSTNSTGDTDVNNPFNRTTAHVTTFLLDNYIMSLCPEAKCRYCQNRSAYQVLATTCLLMGMRLTLHDQLKEYRQQRGSDGDGNGWKSKLTRTQSCRRDLDQTHRVKPAATPSSRSVALPDTATLLRISSAPNHISEKDVVKLVRQMASSRSFPRAKVVTPLAFINVLCHSRTRVNCQDVHIGTHNVDCGTSFVHIWDHAIVDSPQNFVTLGHDDAEEAYRVADASLQDMTFFGCRPSVVACAAISIALIRSNHVNHETDHLRHCALRSVYGHTIEPRVEIAVRQAEFRLLGSTIIRQNDNFLLRSVPTHRHIIPLEDE